MRDGGRHFASDNSAGVHPEIMESLIDANGGHTIAYGNDDWTRHAERVFKDHFGDHAAVFFVFNGTGANVLSLQALSRSFNGILCTDISHINFDECGAPEKFTQCKLIDLPAVNGKLTIDKIRPHLIHQGYEHHVQPAILSITQATEFGTVYRVDEIRDLCAFAHEHSMLVHMDGARISNAAVSLGVSFKEMVTDAGVDILSFGGTKNGLMFGEAVVILKPELIDTFRFIRKQGMQLASKMRFIAAQFSCLLENGLWRRNADHANAMARRLADLISDVSGSEILFPVEINALFVKLPREVIPVLQESFYFYEWDEEESIVRWMTSYDTTEEDVSRFAALIREHCMI